MLSKRKLGLILRIAVTSSILVYLGFKLDWSELYEQLHKSELLWLVLAVLVVGPSTLLGGYRWWLLLKVQKIELPLGAVTALTFIGLFFNSFLLGSTGGDVVRALYVLKYAPNQKIRATLSLVMDRLLGLFVILSIALIAMFWQLDYLIAQPGIQSVLRLLLVIAIAMLVISLGLIFAPIKHFPRGLRGLWGRIPFHHIIGILVIGFREHAYSPKFTSLAIFVSIVNCFLILTAAYFIAIALQLNLTYWQLAGIVPMVLCAISLPISISGHGVREGMFVLLFSALGVGYAGASSATELAVLFSILFFSLFLFWSLIGGLVYLLYRHSYQDTACVGSLRLNHKT